MQAIVSRLQFLAQHRGWAFLATLFVFVFPQHSMSAQGLSQPISASFVDAFAM